MYRRLVLYGLFGVFGSALAGCGTVADRVAALFGAQETSGIADHAIDDDREDAWREPADAVAPAEGRSAAAGVADGPRPRPKRKPPSPPQKVETAGSGVAGVPMNVAGTVAMAAEVEPGLSVREVERRFGLPHARREQAPAEVWRYVAKSCAVELYFYYDLNRQGYRLLHYNLDGGASEAGVSRRAPCLRQIAEARLDYDN